jgi:hypothetical protein
LGIKELGLQFMYCAACFGNFKPFMWMTVFLRATTIPFTLWMTLFLGAPLGAWGGVVQDILFLTWTGKALVDEQNAKKKNQPNTRGRTNNANTAAVAAAAANRHTPLEHIARGIVFGAGLFDFLSASYMMLYPTLGSPIARPLPLGGAYLSTRALGYITGLMGIYQMGMGIIGAPLLMHLSIGLYHLWFWIACTILNRSLVNKPGELYVLPSIVHVVLGLLTTVATLTAAWETGNMIHRNNTKKE